MLHKIVHVAVSAVAMPIRSDDYDIGRVLIRVRQVAADDIIQLLQPIGERLGRIVFEGMKHLQSKTLLSVLIEIAEPVIKSLSEPLGMQPPKLKSILYGGFLVHIEAAQERVMTMVDKVHSNVRQF